VFTIAGGLSRSKMHITSTVSIVNSILHAAYRQRVCEVHLAEEINTLLWSLESDGEDVGTKRAQR